MVCPGLVEDMSSYRSELAGLYAIAFVTQQICDYFHILEGAITVGCDGRSALTQVFNSHINVDEPCHDLILATRHLIQSSPIRCNWTHVKGHQDSAGNDLDRWATLNILMDSRAKSFLLTARRTPRHQTVWGAPWSLWIRGKKLTSRISTAIYDRVHDALGRAYWLGKSDVTEEAFALIDWEAIGGAMRESKRSRRVFLAKHCSGMCGVGKFMLRWKEWDHDLCPRCGVSEDSAHVWRCPGFGAHALWETSINHLLQWMHSVDTHPDIIETIHKYLSSWHSSSPFEFVCPNSTYQALSDQQVVGGRRFFEVKSWTEIQQHYYSLIHSRRSGRRWTIELIKRLWQIAWDIWQHRNDVLHEKEHPLWLQI